MSSGKPLDKVYNIVQPDPDFILLTEFNAQEGPIPLIAYPEDVAKKHMDLGDFALRIMTVEARNPSGQRAKALPNDSSTILIDEGEKIFAYIHHFTLSDVFARGFARPLALTYMTTTKQKLFFLQEKIRVEFLKITQALQASNWITLRRDIIIRIRDLRHTYLTLVDRLPKPVQLSIQTFDCLERDQHTFFLPHISTNEDMEEMHSELDRIAFELRMQSQQQRSPPTTLNLFLPLAPDAPSSLSLSEASAPPSLLALSPQDKHSFVSSIAEPVEEDITEPSPILGKWIDRKWIQQPELEDSSIFEVLNDIQQFDLNIRELYKDRKDCLDERGIQTDNLDSLSSDLLGNDITNSMSPKERDEIIAHRLKEEAIRQMPILDSFSSISASTILQDAEDEDEDYNPFEVDGPDSESYLPNKTFKDSPGMHLFLQLLSEFPGLLSDAQPQRSPSPGIYEGNSPNTQRRASPLTEPPISHQEDPSITVSIQSLLEPIRSPPSLLLPPSTFKIIKLDESLRNIDAIVQSKSFFQSVLARLHLLHTHFSPPLFVHTMTQHDLSTIGASYSRYPSHSSANNYVLSAGRLPLLNFDNAAPIATFRFQTSIEAVERELWRAKRARNKQKRREEQRRRELLAQEVLDRMRKAEEKKKEEELAKPELVEEETVDDSVIEKEINTILNSSPNLMRVISTKDLASPHRTPLSTNTPPQRAPYSSTLTHQSATYSSNSHQHSTPASAAFYYAFPLHTVISLPDRTRSVLLNQILSLANLTHTVIFQFHDTKIRSHDTIKILKSLIDFPHSLENHTDSQHLVGLYSGTRPSEQPINRHLPDLLFIASSLAYSGLYSFSPSHIPAIVGKHTTTILEGSDRVLHPSQSASNLTSMFDGAKMETTTLHSSQSTHSFQKSSNASSPIHNSTQSGQYIQRQTNIMSVPIPMSSKDRLPLYTLRFPNVLFPISNTSELTQSSLSSNVVTVVPKQNKPQMNETISFKPHPNSSPQSSPSPNRVQPQCPPPTPNVSVAPAPSTLTFLSLPCPPLTLSHSLPRTTPLAPTTDQAWFILTTSLFPPTLSPAQPTPPSSQVQRQQEESSTVLFQTPLQSFVKEAEKRSLSLSHLINNFTLATNITSHQSYHPYFSTSIQKVLLAMSLLMQERNKGQHPLTHVQPEEFNQYPFISNMRSHFTIPQHHYVQLCQSPTDQLLNTISQSIFPTVSYPTVSTSFPALFVDEDAEFAVRNFHPTSSILHSSSFFPSDLIMLFDTYVFFPHIILSLLIGLPIVIYATDQSRSAVTQIVSALSFFLPGTSTIASIELWRTRNINPEDLNYLKMCGLSKSKAKLSKALVNQVAFWNFEENKLHTPDLNPNELTTTIIQIPKHTNKYFPLLFVQRVHSHLKQLAEKSLEWYSGMMSNGADSRQLATPKVHQRMFRSPAHSNQRSAQVNKNRNYQNFSSQSQGKVLGLNSRATETGRIFDAEDSHREGTSLFSDDDSTHYEPPSYRGGDNTMQRLIGSQKGTHSSDSPDSSRINSPYGRGNDDLKNLVEVLPIYAWKPFAQMRIDRTLHKLEAERIENYDRKYRTMNLMSMPAGNKLKEEKRKLRSTPKEQQIEERTMREFFLIQLRRREHRLMQLGLRECENLIVLNFASIVQSEGRRSETTHPPIRLLEPHAFKWFDIEQMLEDERPDDNTEQVLEDSLVDLAM
ncbi:hypothetical protein BLNAU_7016 [Blattamonas nauphoetae]|uniref:UDENN FLCN/SMCR8-type domain-containing protein n=1 Tax=Blattamonas nauphoetae TaxID=2049346 RepID=A0ABQ9Y352_9EUKA|nr:hypothetical protein BLNAU_7016 [Blattamonas nauphoetae]